MIFLSALRPDGSAESSMALDGPDESLLSHLFGEWLRDHGWEVEEVEGPREDRDA